MSARVRVWRGQVIPNLPWCSECDPFSAYDLAATHADAIERATAHVREFHTADLLVERFGTRRGRVWLDAPTEHAPCAPEARSVPEPGTGTHETAETLTETHSASDLIAVFPEKFVYEPEANCFVVAPETRETAGYWVQHADPVKAAGDPETGEITYAVGDELTIRTLGVAEPSAPEYIRWPASGIEHTLPANDHPLSRAHNEGERND